MHKGVCTSAAGIMNIRQNTGINLAGSVISMLLSLATVPAYLHQIGAARYGILAIVWIVPRILRSIRSGFIACNREPNR